MGVRLAVSFAAGAALPVLLAALSPAGSLIGSVAAGSLLCLGILGAIAARAGGASAMTGSVRVTFWGTLAMAATAAIGRVFGTVV